MGIPSFGSLDVNCCYYKTYLLHLQHKAGVCKEIVKKKSLCFYAYFLYLIIIEMSDKGELYNGRGMSDLPSAIRISGGGCFDGMCGLP